MGDDDDEPVGGEGHPESLEELCQFHRWSLFLPRLVCAELEQNELYVRTRSQANPQYFDSLRQELRAFLDDLAVLEAAGRRPELAAEVLGVVLRSLRAAHGFECGRQPHKALALNELCFELLEALAARCAPGKSLDALLFWRTLVHAQLGDVLSRAGPGHSDRAREHLGIALDLVEDASAPAGPSERVLAGACYAHLSRLSASEGSIEDAVRHADAAVDMLERYVWELSDSLADRDAQASVLATAYLRRGNYEERRGRYDYALLWLSKAEECLEKYADVGPDVAHIRTQIALHMQKARINAKRDSAE